KEGTTMAGVSNVASEAGTRFEPKASPASNRDGYRSFQLGSFNFSRDEYFAHIRWTGKNGQAVSHALSADAFLRAMMRDVAWGFFYGRVDFDSVIGTHNH